MALLWLHRLCTGLRKRLLQDISSGTAFLRPRSFGAAADLICTALGSGRNFKNLRLMDGWMDGSRSGIFGLIREQGLCCQHGRRGPRALSAHHSSKLPLLFELCLIVSFTRNLDDSRHGIDSCVALVWMESHARLKSGWAVGLCAVVKRDN